MAKKPTLAEIELQKIQKAQEETIPAAELKSKHVFTSAYADAHRDTYGKVLAEKGEVEAFKYMQKEGLREKLELAEKYTTQKAAEVHGITGSSEADKTVLTMGYRINPDAIQKQLQQSGLYFDEGNFNAATRGNVNSISQALQQIQLNFDPKAKDGIAKIVGLNKAKDPKDLTASTIADAVREWDRGKNPLGLNFYNQRGIALKSPYDTEPDFKGTYKAKK